MLIEQIAGYKERENEAEKKEIQYEQLLERYKGELILSLILGVLFSVRLFLCLYNDDIFRKSDNLPNKNEILSCERRAHGERREC